MKNSLCPHCDSVLTSFDLLEDNGSWGIALSYATLEPGLTRNGLRCNGEQHHLFGFLYGELVEIDLVVSSEQVPPPNSSFSEWVNDQLAGLALRYWPNWVPLPKRFGKLLRNQIIVPWLVAESWYVFYNPNADRLAQEEEEARILEEAARDAELDREYGEAIRRQEELDDLTHECEADAWVEHRADQGDRDHDTWFPDDDYADERWDDRWSDEDGEDPKPDDKE